MEFQSPPIVDLCAFVWRVYIQYVYMYGVQLFSLSVAVLALALVD